MPLMVCDVFTKLTECISVCHSTNSVVLLAALTDWSGSVRGEQGIQQGRAAQGQPRSVPRLRHPGGRGEGLQAAQCRRHDHSAHRQCGAQAELCGGEIVPTREALGFPISGLHLVRSTRALLHRPNGFMN